MLCRLSTLEPTALSDVRQREAEIGKPVLAFSCRSMAPAELTEARLHRLQALERKLGVALAAIES